MVLLLRVSGGQLAHFIISEHGEFWNFLIMVYNNNNYYKKQKCSL